MLRQDLFLNLNRTAKRTAAKRAGTSKTSNLDSPGQRLGPKRQENQYVTPQEVIFTQRGTKFYPGENAYIGRDHTINSTEYGFVRYYFDPFHPRRRFIGIALSMDSVLPRDHFLPTERRFGNILLDSRNPREEQQINDLIHSRIDYSNNPKDVEKKEKIQQQMRERIQDHKVKETKFKTKLHEGLNLIWGEEFVSSLNETDKEFVDNFVYSMFKKYQNSENIEAAYEYTYNEFVYDNALKSKRGDLNETVNTKRQVIIPKYYTYKPTINAELATKIQETIDFAKFDQTLILKISEKEKLAKKDALIQDAMSLKPFLYTLENDNFKKLTSLLDCKQNAVVNQIFNKKELAELKDSIFVTQLPVSWDNVILSDKKDKKAVPMKLYNDKTKELEDVLINKFSMKKNAKGL
ncbi:hypothetical protein QEN19_003384 [Hanseniaspora menglaensis]